MKECKLGACGEGLIDECYHRAVGMQWVSQDDAAGCGIAVLAMLCETSYGEVKAGLLAEPWMAESEFKRSGGTTDLSQPVLEKYLAQRGWFFRRVYDKWQLGDGEWPPRPFAERHYAIVANPECGHFVAMDRRGLVLDPLREGNFRLRDWEVVNLVVGLTPSPDPQEAR